MTLARHKILEEGTHYFYIRGAEIWVPQSRPITIIKVSLSHTRRGKPACVLYLHPITAKLWAVQLAEYCMDAGLPWPEFNRNDDTINVIKSLKRKHAVLRVQVTHRSMDGETFYPDAKLLRPS